jgi:diadenosine tetraphosphate (Ap4A) HIT family hydrolase
MPFVIPREEALHQISLTVPPGDCLVCSVLKTEANYAFYKDEQVTVVLSRYPRTWGQTMVLLNAHKTSVTQVSALEWEALMQAVRKAALTIETVLKPKRCYIASLGATQNLPNTCPHIHFNVLPIYNDEDKPSTIFSWQDGVYSGTEPEWKKLHEELKHVFDSMEE